MNDGPDSPRRTGRLVRSIALTAVLALGATACSEDEAPKDESNAASSAAPDTEKATTALRLGSRDNLVIPA